MGGGQSTNEPSRGDYTDGPVRREVYQPNMATNEPSRVSKPGKSSAIFEQNTPQTSTISESLSSPAAGQQDDPAATNHHNHFARYGHLETLQTFIFSIRH
ncbi:hypothetical protein Bbelb_171830 [Branchiostoma belcheri]|nr:hypothetical protein Bbelb_171830 [Branchiostoma belcheri]